MKKIVVYLMPLAFVACLLVAFGFNSVEAKKVTTTTKVPTTTQKPTTKKKVNKVPKVAKTFMAQKVKIKSISLVNKKKIELKINQVNNAQNYILYRQKNAGKVKKLKEIKPGKTTIYDKKARYGNKYKYYIMAYMKYNGKVYASNNNKKGYIKKFKVKLKKKGKYHYFYDMNNKKIKDCRPFLNKPKYSLRVNVVTSTMTVFAKYKTKGYTIPVHVYLIAGNTYDTAGTYKLGPKYRFRGLYYNSHSQWSARIYEDILFHTALYKRSQDPNSLDVKTYNKLGTPSSHGCIRLQCMAAKFIYDKCPVGTRVVLTKSKNPGPLGKPKLEKIKKWHTWDPTDPTMKWKCKKHHCKHKKY